MKLGICMPHHRRPLGELGVDHVALEVSDMTYPATLEAIDLVADGVRPGLR
jgi:hypothetical protein